MVIWLSSNYRIDVQIDCKVFLTFCKCWAKNFVFLTCWYLHYQWFVYILNAFLFFFSFFNSKEIKLSISKSNTPISRKKRNSTFFVRSSHDTNNTQTHFYVIFQPPKSTKKRKKKLVLALKYCPPHYTRVYFKIDGQIFGEGSRRLIARVSVQFHTRATYVRGGRRGVRWGRSLFLTDEARSVEKENAVGWSPPGSTKLGDLSSRNSGPSLRFKRLLPSLPLFPSLEESRPRGWRLTCEFATRKRRGSVVPSSFAPTGWNFRARSAKIRAGSTKT